ncbi:hypothetical protein SAMN04487988_10367 [Algoriphagus hitonicola]|uniref:Lipoprotein n=2 Tax=Algoriphagus hitonicola TaxID=435880 RepID=A0A1I2R405_9BACT|nr:hypothetical protein SAMN04487988_10367 [Algoriphagus hitonicola]
MKINYLVAFATMLVFSFSCQEKENPIQACGVENPVANLTWLNERVEELESTEFGRNYSYISEVLYQGQTLFMEGNCCPNCNSVFTYYDCQGNLFEDEIASTEVTENKLIWKSESSLCTVGE